MPKNTIHTKKGNYGKVDKLIRSKIRMERATGEKSLEKEIGNRGSMTMGSIKREKVKIGT